MGETTRRHVLECMGWAGTGLVWTVNGGVASAARRGASRTRKAAPTVPPFSFAQVSDSHIGFAKDPNPDARATFREAVSDVEAGDLAAFRTAFQAATAS